jgi:hypothetical protein
MLSKLHDRFHLGKHKSFEESLMFKLGQIYQRRELHQRYGGQQQGGISTPRGCSYVFLFTGSGNAQGYHDGWTDSLAAVMPMAITMAGPNREFFSIQVKAKWAR